jgi:DNA-binding beta-propeller fold protein YncE
MFVVALACLPAFAARAQAQQAKPLWLVESIPLSNVEGRIDHFGLDFKNWRLFVSALGNNTVEVLDLRAGKRIHTIRGLREPQGVSYVPEFNKIFIANGGDGSLRVYDGNSFALVTTLDFTDDADNVRYDRAGKRIYVGYGDGALGIVDAATGKRLGDIKLDAHPESFQLEAAGPRIFVNVPPAGHIAVGDRDRRAVIAKWPVTTARANFPMALDEAHQRLFVTCRRPAEFLVFDIASGKQVTSLPVVGDADDMFYALSNQRIYISGGEGFISVIQQGEADHYQVIAKIPTASGARTSFLIPDVRLYLAVPHRANQAAEIRFYYVQP